MWILMNERCSAREAFQAKEAQEVTSNWVLLCATVSEFRIIARVKRGKQKGRWIHSFFPRSIRY